MEFILVACGIAAFVWFSIVISKALSKHTATLAEIHTLVNSRLSEALNDITALKKALVDERRHAERGKR